MLLWVELSLLEPVPICASLPSCTPQESTFEELEFPMLAWGPGVLAVLLKGLSPWNRRKGREEYRE